MEPEPTTNARMGITTQSVASIDLDASQWTAPPQTAWDIEEQQREQEGRNQLNVLQWVYRQDSSRPEPGTVINNPPLVRRMRHNDEIVGLIDNILQPSHPGTSSSKTLSVQTAAASAITTRPNRIHPASAGGNSFHSRLSDSSPALQGLDLTSSFPDRNSKYYDTGHHDEGRPPDTVASDRWQASSSALSAAQTRGVKEEHVPNPGRQVRWASTNPSETDAGSVTKKQPKRQNSRLTDDEQGTRRRGKRRRGRTPSAVSSSTNLPRQATNSLPQTGNERSRQQAQRESRQQSDLNLLGLSNFQDEQPGRDPDCHFSEDKFIGADETCFFWLYNNAKYSTPGRGACQGRKTEISHIVTHAVDHHGLVRGRDPRHTNRAYLMSCKMHEPGTKATGDCSQCKSLHGWEDADFEDPNHDGVALCLRCYHGFTKRDMQTHLAGPLCSYNAEQPKTTKVYILYTTFCSKKDPPSAPPKFDTLSHGRKPARGRNRPAVRDPQPTQGRNQRAGQQTPKEAPNGDRFRSLKPTGRSNKPTPAQRPAASHLQVPSRNPTRLSRPVRRPPSEPSASNSPIWEQSTARNFESQPVRSTETSRALQIQQPMPQLAHNLAPSPVSMGQPSPQSQSPQVVNLHQSFGHSKESPPLTQSTQSRLPQSPQSFSDQLPQFLQSLQDDSLNQLGQTSSHQLGYQHPTNQQLAQSSSSRQVQWPSNMGQSLLPDSHAVFNNFMYTDNLQNLSFTRFGGGIVFDQFDMLPAEAWYSQPTPSQATASQVASNMGEPLAMPSPDMDEPNYLQDQDSDDNKDEPNQLNYIGSNPTLQTYVDRQHDPVRQQTLRPQDLPLDGPIPFGQQVKVEKDSAYESIEQADMEPAESLGANQSTGLDDLNQFIDFDQCCQSPDPYQQSPFTSQGFLKRFGD